LAGFDAIALGMRHEAGSDIQLALSSQQVSQEIPQDLQPRRHRSSVTVLLISVGKNLDIKECALYDWHFEVKSASG